MSTSGSAQKPKTTSAPVPEASIIERIGVAGVLKIAATVVLFLLMTWFYCMIPIAGLGLWPFLFFGCVSLIVGVCDDLGVYR
jgi:hypothetical protein